MAEWEPSLPANIMAVVGIPRGGLHVAAMLAQRRNLPVLSIDEFCGGARPWETRLRRHLGSHVVPKDGIVLVVDDTVCRGGTMKAVRQRMDSVGLPYRTATPYSNLAPGDAVDFAFKRLDHTHQTYEWSLFHDYFVKSQAFDMDGVLCAEWDRPDHGDSLPDYERHLTNAACLNRPTHAIGLIATARVEAYRPQTEAWLRKHRIEYKTLAMMPYESNQARWEATGGDHDTFAGRWKAEQAQAAGSLLFVESSDRQAAVIAQSGLSVLAWPSLKKHNIAELSKW